jgi:N-formylglutamate deformylase
MQSFTLSRGESPLILSMPHPGTGLPSEVAAGLNEMGLRLEDTDWHMREVYRPIEERFQPTVIEATLSRFVIDLNRDPSGVSLYPGQATTELVPTTTFDGAPIWATLPGPEEIARRRELYFEPYHAALSEEIARIREKHGFCVLWDCHSIKSEIPRLFDGRLPMLNLGTNNGAACGPGLQAAAERAMAASGLTHVTNGRFKGGWITRHHGRPGDGVHALQMEMGLNAYLAAEEPPWAFSPGVARPLQEALANTIAATLAAADVWIAASLRSSQ